MFVRLIGTTVKTVEGFFLFSAQGLKMSPKRQGEGDEKRPRKFPTFKSVVLDVMTLKRLQNLMEPVLEPLIRRVVKEEVDTALQKYILNNMKRNCGKDVHPSEPRNLQLKFVNTISLPVFTGTRIEGEGCTNMEVSLIDALTGQVVESSAKVEILVLEGDFDTNKDNWTLEEFTNNIMRERAGKKPLLTGDVIVTLKDGIGFGENVSFTDNSSWTRSRKFRLGARVVENLGGVRVREARSEPFVVRDHRGESYKKHHPPSLSDEVWRLEKIGKDGAFHKRLTKERINTVKDFLMLFFLNPTRLRNILGPGMSAKMWEVTVEHARTCVVGNKLFLYDPLISLQKNGVVFNVVGQVKGMFSNDQYVPTEKLSEAEKANACELVITAFGDRDKIIAYDDEAATLNLPSSSRSSDVQSSSKLPPEAHHQDLSTQNIGRFPYSHSDAPTPDYMQYADINSLDYYFPNADPMEIKFNEPLHIPNQVSEIYDTDLVTQAFCANEPHFERGDFNLPNAFNDVVPRSGESIENTPKGWTILVSVLKWCFSIKRIVKKTRVREIPGFY